MLPVVFACWELGLLRPAGSGWGAAAVHCPRRRLALFCLLLSRESLLVSWRDSVSYKHYKERDVMVTYS